LVLLDYGSGNLRSAQRALERVGAEVTVTRDAGAALDADGLVVPGVGAFAACMRGLEDVGAGAVIRKRVEDERPVLGICVGMQVLFDAGVEHGAETAGLGVFPGRVEQLQAPVLPHMGWNTVSAAPGSRLFAGLDPETRFYFVHSYAAHDTDGTITSAEHGERFVAAVERGAVSATQFHPEKSGDAGAALLENWVAAL
jgi:glutamine amidotransferase